MDIGTLLTNGATLVQSWLLPLGGLLLVVGLGAWAASKPLDSPKLSSLGTRSMVGGVICAGAPTAIAIVKNIGTRIGLV